MTCSHEKAVSTLEQSEYGPVVITVCPDCDKRQAAHPVELVRQQITAPRFTNTEIVIKCPYCGADNVEGKPFCCDAVRKAVELVLGDTTLDA